MRPLGLAAVLAPLLACSPGGPGTSATTGTSGTTTGTTTTATAAPTTSSATTSATTSSSSTSSSTTDATSTTGTTGTTTSTSTGSSTSAGATETDTGSSTDTSTGGVVPAACEVADGDYGPCEAVIGWAWDGSECSARSGCGCGPDCDKFFPDAAACALACASAGHCNEDRVQAAALAMDPIQEGDFCDGVYLCPQNIPDLEDAFEQIFGMLSCEPGNYPCDVGLVCAGLWQGFLGPEEWHKVCAASLVPMSSPIFCVVFGP